MSRSLHLPAIHIGLLAFIGIATADGTPLFYSISFTGGPTLPTAASFSYDPASATFVSFVTTWDGILFDFTSEANIPGGAHFDCSSDDGPAGVFDMLTGACTGNTPPYYWHAEIGSNFIEFSYDNAYPLPSAGLTVSEAVLAPDTSNSRGTYSSTPSSVPEPTSLILTIAGGSILLAARRRRFTRV